VITALLMFWGNVRTVMYDTHATQSVLYILLFPAYKSFFLLFGFIALVSLDSMTFFIIPVICFENAVLYS